jgi:1-acylglycerone phosphate reductase
MAKRTVLITGCTKGGIGYSLAKEFAARDWHVFATARRISSMEGLSSIPNITLLPLDITSQESILSAHSQISAETGGKLDILYHNAGYRSLGLAIESSADEAFKMFNTNLFGILEMNRRFADMVIKTKGKIVFTGSVSGYTPHPTSSVYVATKAALAIYAETLRIEMKPFGVKVVHVATAAVNTGMSSARLEIAEGMDYSLSSTNAYVTDSLQIRIINISKQPLTRVGRS